MTAHALRQKRDDTINAIIEAINALNENVLNGMGAWQPLADLSSRTRFEAIDGDPDSVVLSGSGAFEAIATVYITLVYGPSRDEETMSDEYIATVRGKAVGGVTIDSIVVDTTPFYE